MPRFQVSLTEEHLRVIAAALNELPYRMARPTMKELEEQVEPQREAAEKAAAREGSNVGTPVYGAGDPGGY